MKRLLRILGIVATVYVAYLGTLYTMQEEMLFPGVHRKTPEWHTQHDVELWERDVGEATVEAVWAPHPDATVQSPAPLLVFAHGNGGLVDDYVRRIPLYRRLGFAVLMPEYRGFGRSGGEPGEDAIVADAAYFVDRAVARADVDRGRIVYHGQSLGGGVVASLAREHPPDALILESTFTSVRAFAHQYAAPGFLVEHPFDTEDVLSTYGGPVLVMHARRDPVVPYAMGERLSRAAAAAHFETFDGASHMLPPPGEHDRYWSVISEFLRQTSR